eukprot:5835406-Prorocentrum_lima.AAC.1
MEEERRANIEFAPTDTGRRRRVLTLTDSGGQPSQPSLRPEMRSSKQQPEWQVSRLGLEGLEV